MKAPKVGRLSDLIRQRRQLWLSCIPCTRNVRVDPAAILTQRGDLPLQAFLDRARCRFCGGRNVDCFAPPDLDGTGRSYAEADGAMADE